jgi:acyl-coenzyme A synthetase/AMP-(fatty) acid ligase
MAQHPSIDSVAFFGTPSGDMAAAVVLKKDSNTTAENLKNWLQALVPTQIPNGFYFVSELPRTKVGKIQRYRLAKLFNNSKL